MTRANVAEGKAQRQRAITGLNCKEKAEACSEETSGDPGHRSGWGRTLRTVYCDGDGGLRPRPKVGLLGDNPKHIVAEAKGE